MTTEQTQEQPETRHSEVRSDALLAQFGPKLTPEEVTECIALSGEPCCQACGREWKDHHKRCEGSANARLDRQEEAR